MRTRSLPGAIVAAAVLLLTVWACFDTNPYRAGESKTASLKALPHDLNYNGVGHATGLCDPINYCSACHGASLQGGANGEPSCTGCHGPLWTNKNCGQLNHTINLGGHLHAPNYCQPLDNCTSCHGADLRGGPNGAPSCYSCHAALWNNPGCGQNIHTVNLGGVLHAPNYCRPYQNCVDCHGTNLHGGANGVPSCLECHDQSAWFNCGTTQHNQTLDDVHHASGYCQPLVNCIFCHGDQLQGGPNNEPSCTRCHGQLWTGGGCGGAKRKR